jgi:hypothetical protein
MTADMQPAIATCAQFQAASSTQSNSRTSALCFQKVGKPGEFFRRRSQCLGGMRAHRWYNFVVQIRR